MNKSIISNKISKCVDAESKAQEQLNGFYRNVLSNPINYKNIPDDLGDYGVIRKIEDAWNTYEEERIKNAYLPQTKKEFEEWYKQVNIQHKNMVRPFFQYLARQASLEELALYICLEEKVDGSFDDMIAMAQLGVQGKAKMVMAENYWDEMGNGKAHLVHTKMFSESANFMRNILKEQNIDINKYFPTAALKNGNVLTMYSLRRKYIPRLLGAIGILEDTASERFTATVAGLERFNVPPAVIKYHRVHIHVDSKHGEEWLKYVLIPGVEEGDLDYLQEVCKGILIRFNIAVDYYNSIQTSINKIKHKGDNYDC